MWYFTWILGVLLACAVAIINALWLEAQYAREDVDTDHLPPLQDAPIYEEES